jgi:hypothetical protein
MTTLISQIVCGSSQEKNKTFAERPMRLRPVINIEQVKVNWTIIDRLFKAFQSKDADAILAAYSAKCQFNHPLIGCMSKDEFSKAVQIFIRETPDYELAFQINHVSAKRVEVEWTMTHIFHLTGRIIKQNGKTTCFLSANSVVRQIDQFDRRIWSRQAMGVTGLVLSFVPGWKSFIERELRNTLGISAR